MRLKTTTALALSQIVAHSNVQAAPTWPASTDEIENLMYVQSGYRAPAFAAAVTPCSNSLAQGFRVAASFVRTAFHDVAAFDASAGTGGLDCSIGYEMAAPYTEHNAGPAFYATMKYIYSFYNSKASMSDLLALSNYAAVRSCGGPSIPIKAGRIDATGPGPNALPDAADSKEVLIGRFAKMGFSPQEMIQLVACGHTLGGIHPGVNSAFNPQDPAAAQQAAQSGVLPFDTTDAGFDNRIATEYISGTTQNQLVVGPAALNSDLRVFQVDNNVTIRSMTNSQVFQGTCQTVMAKMLDRVPSNVQLSAVIQPYDVRPMLLNLGTVDNGAALLFSGEIRVRTTSVSVSSVKLVYTGSTSTCTDCNIATTKKGDSQGFDERFSTYGFSAKVTSIKSFTVVVTTTGGQQLSFNNNGGGFPVNDKVFVQYSSSSLSGSGLKVVVAVRNGQSGTPDLTLTQKSAYSFNSLPTLQKSSATGSKICGDNAWSYYSYSFSGSSSSFSTGKLDLSLGGQTVEAFRNAGDFASSGVVPTCPGVTSTSSSTTVSSTSSTLSSSISSSTSSSSTITSTLTSSSTSKASSSSSSSTLTSSVSSSSSSTSSGTSSSSSKTSSISGSSSSTSSGTSSSSSKSSSVSSSTTTGTGSASSSSSKSSSSSSSLTTTSSSSQSSSVSATLTSTSSSETTSSKSKSDTSATTTATTFDGTIITTTTTTVSGSYTWTTTGTYTWTSTTTKTNGGSPWDPIPTTTTASEWSDWYVTTVDAVTTYCPYPTTIVTNGHSYTVYKPTMLTITDCPCTITVSGKGKGGAQPTQATTSLVPTGQYAPPDIPDHYQGRANSAVDSMAQAYKEYSGSRAPNGGTDGGNKNVQGLDLHITVVIVTNTITGTKYYGPPTDTGAMWSPAATTFQSVAWTGVPVNPAKGTDAGNAAWSPYQPTGVSNPSASNTKWGPVATFKGAANPMMARGEIAMAAGAAVVGAIAMVL